MRTMKLASEKPAFLTRLKDYREIGYFILFTVFCMLLAANRGFFNEFSSAEAFLIVLGIVLLDILTELGGNRRLALCVLILMTIGNLVRGAIYANYIHSDGYRNVRMHLLIAMLVMIAAFFLYGKLHALLSSRTVLLVFFLLSQACYILMRFGGSNYNGAIISFHGLNLLELQKIFFIGVTAGLLCRRRPDAKAQDKAVLLSIGNMLLHALWLIVLSDLGTLIVIGFVYIIFLFIFPNKLRFVGGVLTVIGTVFIAGMVIGGRIYQSALTSVPAQLFASAFTDDVHDVNMPEVGQVTWDEALKEMAVSHLQDDALKDNPEMAQRYANACRMLGIDVSGEEDAAGETTSLTKADFDKAYDIKVAETAQKVRKGENIDWRQDYPAAVCITDLCSYAPFRNDYIDIFLRDTYQTDVRRIYNNYHPGIFHFPARFILSAYDKAAQRLGSSILPEEITGIAARSGGEEPYQISQALKAMRVGGWTGAGAHEFIYVPVMTTDMVYSQVISQFGFIMGLFVILMYMIIFREGVGIERRIGEERAPYHKGLVLGLSLMLFIQALVIMGGNLNVFPLTGITLPFISEGGVSLIVCSLMVGVMLSTSVMKLQEDEMTDRYVQGILTKWMNKLGIKMDQVTEKFFAGLDRVDLDDEDLVEDGEVSDEESDVETVYEEDAEKAADKDGRVRRHLTPGDIGPLDEMDEIPEKDNSSRKGNTFTEGTWEDDDL